MVHDRCAWTIQSVNTISRSQAVGSSSGHGRKTPSQPHSAQFQRVENAAPNAYVSVNGRKAPPPTASAGFIRRKTPPPTASARFNGRKTPPPTASARFNGRKTPPQPLPWASTDEKRRPQPPPWASTDEKRRPSPPSNGRKLVPAPASGRFTGHKLTHVVGWRRYFLAACDSQLRRRWP